MTIKPTQYRVPGSFAERTHEAEKAAIKAKYVPRAPKDGEIVARVDRPQMRSGDFATYERGDYLRVGTDRRFFVIVAAKAGFSRGGEGWKKWEQIVVAREPNAAELTQIQDHEAVQDEIRLRVMDQMMSS